MIVNTDRRFVRPRSSRTRLPNVEELHLASWRRELRCKDDEGAEAMLSIRVTSDRSSTIRFGGWDHGTDPGVEAVGHLGDHLSVASHDVTSSVCSISMVRRGVAGWSGIGFLFFETSSNGGEWVRESFSYGSCVEGENLSRTWVRGFGAVSKETMGKCGWESIEVEKRIFLRIPRSR